LISETIAGQLHHVKLSTRNLDLNRFPAFFILGPQRTGTTRLHAQLRFHPQIMLSEPKEIFFFSRLKTPQHPKFVSADLGWYLKFFRDRVWWRAVKTAICFRRFGELYRPLVRGEATASYAAIDDDVIREVVLLKPDLRAILMIRDPVERAWSHAKKDLVRNRKRELKEVSAAEFASFFSDDYQLRCARYVENIERWGRRLQPGHLFVALFDDIALRPEALLLEVMQFLGVRSDRRYIPADVRATVNPTAESRIPPAYKEMLEEILRPQIEQLRQRFGLVWPRPADATAQSFIYQG
jgi:hypothetical protein